MNTTSSIKSLKFLISAFLIFSLAISECFIDSDTTKPVYHQVSFVNTDVKANKQYVVDYSQFVNKYDKEAFTALASYQYLKKIDDINSTRILKITTIVYQSIKSNAEQHLFLKSKKPQARTTPLYT